MKTMLLALTVVATLAAPLYAMDSLNMPTANLMKAGTSELNFIYINMPQKKDPAGNVKMDDMRYLKLFNGVTDRLQVDVCHLDIKDGGNHTVLNAYYALAKENASHPSLVVGATNLTGETWLGGSDFGGSSDYDDASPFVVSAYNLAKPAKPTWQAPVVRLNVGWGDKFHDDEFFGNLMLKFDPRFAVVAQDYKSLATYFATWQATDDVQLTAGTMDGNTFYRVGGVFKW